MFRELSLLFSVQTTSQAFSDSAGNYVLQPELIESANSDSKPVLDFLRPSLSGTASLDGQNPA
jgi:hypothetical protein